MKVLLKKNAIGFSLLEIIASLAIVAITTSIGYPLFSQHLVKTHRQQAEVALLHVANRLDEFYALEGHYDQLSAKQLNLQTINKSLRYHVKIAQASDDHFTISAIPDPHQARQDKRCGILSVNEMGKRFISGTGSIGECWLI